MFLINTKAVGRAGAATYDVHFMVVAGGGAGSADAPSNVPMTAGGGAGGFRTSWAGGSGGGGSSEPQASLSAGSVYTIAVGAGGAVRDVNGIDSSIIGSGVSIVSLGGGSAGWNNPTFEPAASGGSGGGGTSGAPPSGAGFPGGSGAANQGYPGGVGGTYDTRYPQGGGGGATEIGHNTVTHGNSNGGAGKQVNIDTNNYYFSGGGGAASHSPTWTANGGIGGGGRGMGYPTVSAGTAGGSAISSDADTHGGTNTGGGAGGTTWYNPPGSHGGSGCVILRIPTVSYSGTRSGAEAVTTDGSDTILTFKGTGSYTA